jgi:hypothetical protein
MASTSVDLEKFLGQQDALFKSQQYKAMIAQGIKAENAIACGITTGSMGSIGIMADWTGALANTKFTSDVLHTYREALVKGVLMNAFKEIVMKTPVGRGTARLNWKVKIGEKTATYRSARSGKASGYMNIFDKELKGETPANKIGNTRAGSRYRKSTAAEIYSGDQSDVGSERYILRKDGSVDTFTTQLTQRNFGRMTGEVQKLFQNVETLIRKEFGTTGRYRDKDKMSVGPQMKKIYIFNETPYIRYLEGESKYGARYPSGGGSKIFADKRGSSSFVNMYKPSENTGDYDNIYEPGFILAGYQMLRSAMASDAMKRSGYVPVSERKPKGRKMGRKVYTYKATNEAWNTYMYNYRRGGDGSRIREDRPEKWLVLNDDQKEKRNAELAEQRRRRGRFSFKKMWRSRAMKAAGFKMHIANELDEARADLWYLLQKQVKRLKAVGEAGAKRSAKQSRVKQSVADLLENASKKKKKSEPASKSAAASPAKKSAVGRKFNQASEKPLDVSGDRPPRLRKRKSETGSEFLARKRDFEDRWWKEKNKPAPKYRWVAKPYRKQNEAEGFVMPSKPKRRRKKKD